MRLAWPPPWYLVASVLISVIALALVHLSPSSLQGTLSLLALILVLLIPGYLAVLSAFPGKSDITLQRRAFFCLAASVLLAGLFSLILTATPRGLNSASLATILSLLAIFLAAVAYGRWSDLPRNKRFLLLPRRGLRSARAFPRISKTTIKGRRAALAILLLAACFIAALAFSFGPYQILSGESFTELEVTWPGEALSSPSSSIEEGKELFVLARIISHEKQTMNYTLKLIFRNCALFSRNLVLGQGESWQDQISFMLTGPATLPGPEALDLLLYKEGDLSSPCKEEHLWFNLSRNNSVQSSSQSQATKSTDINSTGLNATDNSSIKINTTESSSPVIFESASNVTVFSAGGGGSGGGSSSGSTQTETKQPASQTAKQPEKTASSLSTATSTAASNVQSNTPVAGKNVSSLSIPSSKENQTGKDNTSLNDNLTSSSPASDIKANIDSIAGKISLNAAFPEASLSSEANLSRAVNQSKIELDKSQEQVNPNSPPRLADLQANNSQPLQGSSVLWMANASDAEGDKISYRFLVNDKEVTEWSTSNSWIWNTFSLAPGDYKISVLAKDDKSVSTDPFGDSLHVSITLLPSNQLPVLKALVPDKASPQLQGVAVFWRAEASDEEGDKILYKFLLNGQEASKWSKANSWSWLSVGLPAGDYQITVLAIDGKHASEDSFDSYMNASFTLSRPNQSPVLQELKSDKASPQGRGGTITWTASATDPDNDRISYRFMKNDEQVTDWSTSNSWIWDTSSEKPGEYRIAVQAKDGLHASENSFDCSLDGTFALTLPNGSPGVTELNVDRSSPQAQGAVITWTASANDPDNDKVYYRFMKNDEDVTDWSTSNSWIWDTSLEKPGDYRIAVQAKDGLHASENSFDSSLNSSFVLTSVSNIPEITELKADRSSPQARGSVITWTAIAVDPDEDETYYKFLANDREVRGWSSSSSWVWDTSSATPGDYKIKVLARDGKHAPEDSFDSSKVAAVTILAPDQPPVLKALEPDKSSPQVQGAAIFWKAEAIDEEDDKILYKFLLDGREVRKWSKANSWSWLSAGLPAGEYQITALAIDGKHASEDSFDSIINASFTLSRPNQAPVLQDLKPDKASPQGRGGMITWTASANDPDNDKVYYKFMKNDEQVTDWSTSKSWIWDTSSEKPGEYRIAVQAKDGLHASDDSFDSSLDGTFALMLPNGSPEVTELKADRSSPQARGGVITWTAIAVDPDEDETYYKFLANDREVRDWSSSNSWVWDTSSAAPGDYTIRVLARDGKHASEDSFDSSKDAAITIEASNELPALLALVPDKSSPQIQGATIIWTAEAQDPEGDKILYKFQLNGRDMSRWSESASWKWSSRDLAAGDYKIRVLARDGKHASEDSFDSSMDAVFSLITEIDQQIDQLMKKRSVDTSKEENYQSSDIQVASGNGTKSNAVLGKSSSTAEQENTVTPRKLGS